MATDVEVPLLENQFDRLSIASEDSIIRSDLSKEEDDLLEEWGFTLKDLYRLATKFYKDKEGKAIHLSYQDKLKLVAYKCQVSHGNYTDNQESLSPLGVLDVIGRDRRLAWQSLGNLSKEDAMQGFVTLLNRSCPLFKPSVEANKADLEERERIAREEEEKRKVEDEQKRTEEEQKRKEEEDQAKQEAQRRQIQDALNQQTYLQFKSYSEQQFPGNPEQQAVLIRQLQEHHYHQYMQQLCQQQATHEPPNEETQLLTNGGLTADAGSAEESEDEGSQASMWTRKDISEFKESIRKDAGDAIIKVGHGETVTIRIPTHPDGSCLFWEFATDSYDIGFGVYFEWTKPETSQVTVHISESEEDEEEEDDDDEELTAEDLEQGANGEVPPKVVDLTLRPPTSVIVPVYRRDCQEEVYAGSHVYPGQGVYLLKFDNSYSLWRSKTLYYRVYYTR